MTRHITYNWKIVRLHTRGKPYGIRLNGKIKARATSLATAKKTRNRMIENINRKEKQRGARIASDTTGRRFS